MKNTKKKLLKLLTNSKQRSFYYQYFVNRIRFTIFVDSSVVLDDIPLI